MQERGARAAIIVTSALGRASRAQLEREATAGERPRKDYVELARVLGADVIDGHHMAHSAALLPRLIARWVHFRAGQIAEVFLRPRWYKTVVTWGDFPGLLLAVLFKVARSRRGLFMVAQYTSLSKKAALLRRFGAHTHLRAIIYHSSVQFGIAASKLNVAPRKMCHVLQPVDERFWAPASCPAENLICAAGIEARDYATLVEAVRGLDVVLELGVASTTSSGSAAVELSGLGGVKLPANVRLTSPSLPELRSLYARSQFVVVPLQEREYDAGSTAVTEAMAMGKAVIVTRIRGQVDLVQHELNGLYVPPRDPAALRAAMERLLANPDEAERIGRAGRALVEERHTLDGYTDRLAGVIGGAARA